MELGREGEEDEDEDRVLLLDLRLLRWEEEESVLEPDGEEEEDEEKFFLQDLLAVLLLLELGGEGEGEGDEKGILFFLLDLRRLLEGDKDGVLSVLLEEAELGCSGDDDDEPDAKGSRHGERTSGEGGKGHC